MHKKIEQERARLGCEIVAHLIAVSSERKPESSSSDGCLLAAREDWRDVGFELVREVAREASREAALREVVLPLSKIWRRRSGIVRGVWREVGEVRTFEEASEEARGKVGRSG